MSETAKIQSALRRLTRPDRAPALAAALGFQPSDRIIPRSDWSSLGIREAPLRTIRIAGTHDGGEVLFLGFTRNPEPAEVARIARAIRNTSPLTHRIYIAAAAGHTTIIVATFGLEGEIRHLTTDRRRPRPSDIETLADLTAPPGVGPTALTLLHARALDRARVTRQFFDDVRARRDAIARAWRGIPRRLTAEREQLALLLLCRFMFLYFLQRRRHLANDPNFLGNRLARYRRNPGRSFYRDLAIPLFFGALNTRPEHRSAEAHALGSLPYLNGGLFEPHALERRFPNVDLPDPPIFELFDQLLERYRFTTRDAADDLLDNTHDVGIDPEMLGRVFEGLMAADRRGDTGTFYTPSATVDRLVAETLATHLSDDSETTATAIRDNEIHCLPAHVRRRLATTLPSLTVLDPACGSGAFLLGALSRIAHIRTALENLPADRIRRDIVGHGLHGVDVQGDAALLCALRLWLALAGTARDDAPVPPLPNLDRQVRQGDALLDPLLLRHAGYDDREGLRAAADPAVLAALRELQPLASAYLQAESADKQALRQQIASAETRLADAWISALDARLEHTAAEIATTLDSRDLFGERAAPQTSRLNLTAINHRRTELRRLRDALGSDGTLPFFSFPIHFAGTADRGFDIILCNPPWVRAHRWPSSVGPLVRRQYRVCASPGWARAARLTGTGTAAGGQTDLSLLFLERGLGLLRQYGTLGMILPAKMLRSLYAAPARRMLLNEPTIASIEDHSLDQRSIFRADAFAATIVTRKGTPPTTRPPVRVTMVRRGGPDLRFDIPQHELPLFPDDPESPWLLAPADVRHALRRMQHAGRPLGEHTGLRVRRGAFTGANDCLLIRACKPRLGNLATIRATGFFANGARPARHYEATIESDCLRPVLRGADIDAWRFDTTHHVVWLHGDGDSPTDPPPRLARYLRRHAATLESRTGNAAGPGHIFRTSRDLLRPKVAWHDLAERINAVAVPGTIRSAFGTDMPVVPLNTVYYIAMPEWDAALLLTALLN